MVYDQNFYGWVQMWWWGISERCFKWSGGVIKESLPNNLKRVMDNGKIVRRRKGDLESVTTPPSPSLQNLILHML